MAERTRLLSKVRASFFDERPIKLDGFTLGARGITPVGRPTREQWQGAFDFCSNVEEVSGYWVGDLLAYADTREDWREKFDQMKSATGLAEQTLHNLTTISRRVRERERRASPSISHSKIVTKLEADEQLEWLERARTNGWTAVELAANLRSAGRTKIIEGQAKLEGMYRVIYCDFPWIYGNKPPSGSGAQTHYPGMTIEDGCKLPVKAHARPDCVLFFWVTSPMLFENPGPRELVEAWGFHQKSSIVWDKVEHGFGSYVSIRHELLLICTRGSCTPDRPTPMIDSVQTVRAAGLEHSEKPEDFRQIIERLYDGPYLELFGRKRVEGWDVFGNDARLWADEKATA
jgi:N6-adenosine-specific RNA methylase IME4